LADVLTYFFKKWTKVLAQGRPTQVGLWVADQLFSHNLGRNLSKT
jgi:hypothetical protein